MCGTYITFNKSYWEMTGLLETRLIMMIVMKTQPLPWCGRVPCRIKRIGLTLKKSTSALKIPLVQIYGPSFTLNERKNHQSCMLKRKKYASMKRSPKLFGNRLKAFNDNVVQRQGKVRVDIFKDWDLTGMHCGAFCCFSALMVGKPSITKYQYFPCTGPRYFN